MDRDSLCRRIDEVLSDMQMAYANKSWTSLEFSYDKLQALNGQLRKADDFEIETGIGR